MQTLSTILVALLGLALAGGTIYFALQAGPHATLGTFSDLMVPTLVTIAIILVCAAGAGLGAWALWQREYKMAAQLLGVLAAVSPLMVWKTADAANVVLDTSEPERHDTTLIERRTRKDREYFVIQSWRDPEATLMIATSDVVWDPVEPGEPAVLVVHAGAFGRPYAVSLSPR